MEWVSNQCIVMQMAVNGSSTQLIDGVENAISNRCSETLSAYTYIHICKEDQDKQ